MPLFLYVTQFLRFLTIGATLCQACVWNPKNCVAISKYEFQKTRNAHGKINFSISR